MLRALAIARLSSRYLLAILPANVRHNAAIACRAFIDTLREESTELRGPDLLRAWEHELESDQWLKRLHAMVRRLEREEETVVTSQTEVQQLVDRYIALLEERAPGLGPIKRFYAYMADDLQEVQWQVQEHDPTEQPLHDALVRVYARWLDEMTPEERRELFAYNRQQRGEWRSHILEEELEPLYASRDTRH